MYSSSSIFLPTKEILPVKLASVVWISHINQFNAIIFNAFTSIEWLKSDVHG